MKSPHVPREGHQSGERRGRRRFAGRIGRPPGQILRFLTTYRAGAAAMEGAEWVGLRKRRGPPQALVYAGTHRGGMISPRQPRRRSRTGRRLPLCRKPCSGRYYTPSCDARKYPRRILWITLSRLLKNERETLHQRRWATCGTRSFWECGIPSSGAGGSRSTVPLFSVFGFRDL